MEEARLATTAQALRRRFECVARMSIALEVGIRSPWVSRLLEELGHEVLMANARKLRLIYKNRMKTDKVDAVAPAERLIFSFGMWRRISLLGGWSDSRVGLSTGEFGTGCPAAQDRLR